MTPQSAAALDKAGLTARSGAARSTSGKVAAGRRAKAKSGASRSVAGKVGTVGRARAKTSSQIAAARRNIAKAQQAARRKLGGTTALRVKVGARRLVSKAKVGVLKARVAARKVVARVRKAMA